MTSHILQSLTTQPNRKDKTMLKNSLSNAEVTLTIREYVDNKKLQQFQVSALLKQFNILRRQLGDKKALQLITAA